MENSSAPRGAWPVSPRLHLPRNVFIIIVLIAVTAVIIYKEPIVLVKSISVFLKIFCLFVFLAVLGLPCHTGFSLAAASRGYSSCGAWASAQRLLLLWSKTSSNTASPPFSRCKRLALCVGDHLDFKVVVSGSQDIIVLLGWHNLSSSPMKTSV